MPIFFPFYILRWIFSNPLAAILIIVVIYLIFDRRFVGLIPDIFRPLRHSAYRRKLLENIKINPSDAKSLFEIGSLLVEKRQWKKAIPYLEKALKRLENSQSYYLLGVAYFCSGRQKEGKELLEKALELNPKVGYGEPYIYLVEYELSQNREVQQIPGLEDTLRQYGSTGVCYRLGRLFEEAGQTERAQKMYKEALETYRQSPAFLRRQHRRAALSAWIRQILAAS